MYCLGASLLQLGLCEKEEEREGGREEGRLHCSQNRLRRAIGLGPKHGDLAPSMGKWTMREARENIAFSNLSANIKE